MIPNNHKPTKTTVIVIYEGKYYLVNKYIPSLDLYEVFSLERKVKFYLPLADN